MNLLPGEDTRLWPNGPDQRSKVFCLHELPPPSSSQALTTPFAPLDSDRDGWPHRLKHWDPRIFQIAALILLLTIGLVWFRLDVRLVSAMLILASALATQFVASKLWSLPRFDPRSALISGLSLCLLLRSNSVAVAIAAAVAAILSKFLLRWNGKHIFNPTNFALVLMMLLTGGRVWVSPGQWGDIAFFSFLVLCVGACVVNRASRSDVTIAFLVGWLVILFGRSLWLGEPLSIPAHRLRNGALLVFAFFMISDPRTTPNSRAGRVLFACLVALGAGYVQFKLFRTNGLLWSLAACSPLVPVIDRVLPGNRYQWNPPHVFPGPEIKPHNARLPHYEPNLAY
jgi:Na+-transporting NADH:ubiquinone oxidoreductase subunit NqrB